MSLLELRVKYGTLYLEAYLFSQPQSLRALFFWEIMILKGFGGYSKAASWMWVFVCLVGLLVGFVCFFSPTEKLSEFYAK